MPKYSTCPFCGKNDAKPSKEHLLGKWFAKEFSVATWYCIDDLTGYKRDSTKYLHLVTRRGRRPCERCNNEWLERIEAAARPILIPLMRGHSIMLAPKEVLTLATWFFGRVLIFDLICENETPRPCFFEDHERHQFCQRHTWNNLYQFFIAAYSEQFKGFAREDRLIVSRITPDQPTEVFLPAYSFTFCIGHLILQIFCVKGVNYTTRYYMRNFDDFCFPFVPKTPITWPPNRVFGPSFVNEFVYRWSRHLGAVADS